MTILIVLLSFQGINAIKRCEDLLTLISIFPGLETVHPIHFTEEGKAMITKFDETRLLFILIEFSFKELLKQYSQFIILLFGLNLLVKCKIYYNYYL